MFLNPWKKLEYISRTWRHENRWFFFSKGYLTTSLNKTVSTVSFRGNLRSSVIYYLISLCQKSLLSTLIFTKGNTFGLLSLFNWAPLLGSWSAWISTLGFSLHILKLSTSEGNVHCCIHIQILQELKKKKELSCFCFLLCLCVSATWDLFLWFDSLALNSWILYMNGSVC